MKKAFAGFLIAMFLSGCAETMAILDVLADKPKPPAPAPICDASTVGIQHDGKTCLKYDDGAYRWTAK